jgi:uncharacterized membrane protein
MDNENFMETGRLEAFYDAIIAIIVTVLVLELPQPATASLASIWALKTSYFAYVISFLVCANLWQYHHIIYNHVDKINKKNHLAEYFIDVCLLIDSISNYFCSQ